ncbi:MAG: GTP cyclohydrolase II [Candidatus Thermoplasmatota archaeon]|jgi:GTP cyclohydrolase II/3,4-dihydroxy 2-butanone 4-phosphate synthase/GTP cyclohydrolase II|nr:GTP cyclohydrolase II [Candidatus Thermoplasmatota archaeon]MCL5989490.1 GTP cyclohydrolase II [Candidatus Thermoplasmatota archaeon]
MLELYSKAKLPTVYGLFEIYAFKWDGDDKENAVLVKGDIMGQQDIPVRIHSECLTGDVFSSQRCDCHDQLVHSLSYLGSQPKGLLIYLRQEGRGIGLLNKIKAYSLQEMGYDTVEANLMLGFPADTRDYSFAVEVLKYFNLHSIKLLTNNPDKIEFLEKNNITVSERIPILTKPTPYDKFYLETKKIRMRHQI